MGKHGYSRVGIFAVLECWFHRPNNFLNRTVVSMSLIENPYYGDLCHNVAFQENDLEERLEKRCELRTKNDMLPIKLLFL